MILSKWIRNEKVVLVKTETVFQKRCMVLWREVDASSGTAQKVLEIPNQYLILNKTMD